MDVSQENTYERNYKRRSTQDYRDLWCKTLKDDRLRTIATFDGKALKDDRLRTIATFDGKSLKDDRLRTIATFDGKTLKDDRLRTIATFDGKTLKDDRLRTIATVNGNVSIVVLAFAARLFWGLTFMILSFYFYIKKIPKPIVYLNDRFYCKTIFGR